MSTDPIGVAFGRDDATVAAHMLQIAAEPSNELSGIATAIERVEALLAACGPGPDGADAIERIADIAFVLHERDVEASLCDALDAAVRELANADAAKQVNVQHVRQAAELLRDLSHRVGDMIALLQVSPPAAANGSLTSELALREPEATPADELRSSEDALNGDIPREGLFAAELLEDDEFARAVAELAASLPSLAEPVEAFVVTLREPADLAADEAALTTEPSEGIAEAQHEAVALVGDESALASEREEALAEMQQEPSDLAADESALAPEPAEALSETRHEPTDLAAALQEAIPEAQHEAADLAADATALALEPQLPAMSDASVALEQTLPEDLPIADRGNEQLARDNTAPPADTPPEEPKEEPKDEAISNTTLLSESALSETPSGEALLEDADATAAPPPDLRSDAADHVWASGHAASSPPEANSPCVPAETPTPAPEQTAEDIALAPDESTVAVIAVDAPHSTAEPAADGVAAEQPSDQVIVRSNGGAGPAQIADETNPHDVNDMVAETKVEVNDAPPPRVSESSQSLLPELALVDPQDDPGDLFEPLAGGASPAAGALASEVSTPADAMQAHSDAQTADPLAAMRALSSEELLALFT